MKERGSMVIPPPIIQCVHALVETNVLPLLGIKEVQVRKMTIELTERQLAWLQNEAKNVLKYPPKVGQVENVVLDVEINNYDNPNKIIGLTFLCVPSLVLMLCAEQLPKTTPGNIYEICGGNRLKYVSNRVWHYDPENPPPTLIIQPQEDGSCKFVE